MFTIVYDRGDDTGMEVIGPFLDEGVAEQFAISLRRKLGGGSFHITSMTPPADFDFVNIILDSIPA